MIETPTAQQLHVAGLIAYDNRNWGESAEMHDKAIVQAWVEDDEFLVGVAQRDLSAALVQGDGGLANAVHASEASIGIFERIGDERELGASYDAQARVFLRAAVKSEQNAKTDEQPTEIQLGSIALKSAQKAGELLTNLPGKTDQYYVNSIRREVAAEGLFGSKLRALRLGIKAVALAMVSQSPIFIQNTETTKNFANKAKIRARQLGSVGILFAAGSLSLFGDKTRQRVLSLVEKSKV